jgi:type 1 glutamine amidotransferase
MSTATDILILKGGWPGHSPHQFSEFFKERYGARYSMNVEDDICCICHLNLNQYKLIVPIWTQGTMTDAQSASLCQAIESGVSLLAWHGAADAFHSNSNFKLLLGGTFIAHPAHLRLIDAALNWCMEVSTIRP